MKKINIKWTVIPSETPLHSYIIEKVDLFTGVEYKFGPIPDVLIGETLHELRESKKQMIGSVLNNMR